MFNLDDCVAFLTSRVAKTLAVRLENKISKYGVSRVKWIAMYYVHQNSQLTQKQLADHLAITEASVVRLIDRMENDALIYRISCQDDKRKKYIILTDKGRDLYLKITALAEEFKDDAIRSLSETELDIYKQVLNKMIENTDYLK